MSTPSYPVLRHGQEADPDGESIPMAGRMKLDVAAVTIPLAGWQALLGADRRE